MKSEVEYILYIYVRVLKTKREQTLNKHEILKIYRLDKREKNINSNWAYLFVIDWAATVKVPKTEWDNLYLLPKSTDEHHKPIILNKDDSVEVNWKIIDVFNF